MANRRVSTSQPQRRSLPPAATPEIRELQLQALAYDVVEQRMLNNEASAQELTYFLKGASRREKLELQKLENEARLAEAKIEQLAQAANQQVLLERAMAAFAGYRGEEEDENDAH